MNKACTVLDQVIFQPVQVPALNKWTKVAPCMRHISVMQNFCNLVPRAFESCFRTSKQIAEQGISDDEGEEVGAPVNQTKVWQKLAKLRLCKAGFFLQDQQSRWSTAVWVVLTEPIMRIHYALFKYATWLADRDAGLEEDEDLVEEAAGLALTAACFCKASQNPAKKALCQLTALLHNMSHLEWGPAELASGPVSSWSQPRLRITRRCFCIVIGQLFLKLIYPWTQYPWRLAALIDPEETRQQRAACAADLFTDHSCCLDCFARKLKETQGSPDSVQESEVLCFLEAAFERVVPTSTFVERMFARLTEWSKNCNKKGPKPHLSSVAAKHVAHSFERQVSRWRTKVLKQPKIKANIQRPKWSKSLTSGRCLNGWHLFRRDFFRNTPDAGRARTVAERNAEVRQAWLQTSREEKARLAALARAANLQSRTVARARAATDESQNEPAIGGPWGISASHGFPMSRHIVDGRCHEVNKIANDFKRLHNTLQPEDEDSLQGAPPEPGPLFPQCPREGCEHSVPAACRPTLQNVTQKFWKVVQEKAPKPDASSQEPLLLAWRSSSTGLSRFLAVIFHTRRPPWHAAVLMLHQQAEQLGQDVLFSLRCSSSIAYPQLELRSGAVFLAGLAQEASDWRIAALEAGPVALLGRFDIVAERVIEEPHSLGATEDAQVGQDAQTALDALRLLQPPGPKKQRSGPGGGPRKGTRSKNKQDVQATKLAEEQKLMGIVPCASDSEGVPSDLDFESASEGGAQDRGYLSDDAEAFPAPQASSSSSGVPPGVPASSSAAASASRPKRTLQKRAVAWGVFQLAPIYNRGQHTGWGAMCNLHSDAADRANVACKKARTKGALSDNECQLRLKRWLVAGLDDSSWPKDGARSAHVSLGGVQLAHFAHGLSAQQLDARVCPSRGAA